HGDRLTASCLERRTGILAVVGPERRGLQVAMELLPDHLHRDREERIAAELPAGRDHFRNRQRVDEGRETHLRVGALRGHERAAAAEGDGASHRAAGQLEELPPIESHHDLLTSRPRVVRGSSRHVLRDGTSRSLDTAVGRILDALEGSQWGKTPEKNLLSSEMKKSAAENKT